MAAQLKPRSLTLELVNQAGDELVVDNEHFNALWRYAESDRRCFLLALCHRESSGPDPLRLGVIQAHLERHCIEIRDEDLIGDLDFLRELEVIDLVGEQSGGHYTLSIPLMGAWIEKQQNFDVLLTKAKADTEDQYE